MKRIIQAIKDATRFTKLIAELAMVFSSDKPKIKVKLTEDQVDILIICTMLGVHNKDDLRKALK